MDHRTANYLNLWWVAKERRCYFIESFGLYGECILKCHRKKNDKKTTSVIHWPTDSKRWIFYLSLDHASRSLFIKGLAFLFMKGLVKRSFGKERPALKPLTFLLLIYMPVYIRSSGGLYAHLAKVIWDSYLNPGKYVVPFWGSLIKPNHL